MKVKIAEGLIFLLVCYSAFAETAEPAMRIRNAWAQYAIGTDARNIEFVDRRTGIDYCAHKGASTFAHVKKGGKEFPATAASYTNGLLSIEFGEAKVTAGIRVTIKSRHFIFEVEAVRGDELEEFTFLDLPLTLKGSPEEPFAGCALALNLRTDVRDLPRATSRLRAICHRRFGLVGSKVAIIGCAKGELRKAMQEIVNYAPDLPHSPMGGPWALDATNNYASYLMAGRITENEVDDWIHLARAMGMRQIDFQGGNTSFRHGDFELNKKNYPRGRASLKAVTDKLHAAGIQSGLHTYAFFISKFSKYATPAPDPRLAKDATFTLAEELPREAVTVLVFEPSAKMSTVVGTYTRNSVTLQIDEELITYSGIRREAPFAFTNCERGACGTRVAEHAKGAKVHHLRECFGMFAPDGDSTLFTEIAANTAEIYNQGGFDMIYLDALDGADVIAGEENAWYYASKFAFEIWNRLHHPALMEMSTMEHHLWFLRSRMGAWDEPSRAYKKFIDMHCATNQFNRALFLPETLGWWSFKPWNGIQPERTFPDDIEYLCGKALANDFSIAIGATPADLAERLAGIVKNYEELRLSNYFIPEVKKELAAPGHEFTLIRDAAGEWQFRRVEYSKHKVAGIDGWSDHWTITNNSKAQPLQLRIEALFSTGLYDAPGNITLADFQNTNDFTVRGSAPEVTAIIVAATNHLKIAAASTKNSRERTWAKFGKIFTLPMNLTNQPALGAWVYGDGKGQVLNVQLNNPPGIPPADADHYIKIDFKGWRYFELVEPEGERFADYSWPYGNLNTIYRDSIAYSKVHALSLFFNNIPVKDEVTCYLRLIRALPVIKAALRNPAITVGGKTITFPVEIQTGSYLEFHSPTDCKLYGAKGELIREVTPQGDVPSIEGGLNELKFTCEHPARVNPRANISVVTFGDTLRAANAREALQPDKKIIRGEP